MGNRHHSHKEDREYAILTPINHYNIGNGLKEDGISKSINQYTKDEQKAIKSSYAFYISIRLLNNDENLIGRLSKYMFNRDKFKSYILDAWTRTSYTDVKDPSNCMLLKLLGRRITFTDTNPDIATIGDVEYDEIKAILKISSHLEHINRNIIDDIYKLQEYITTLDKSRIRSIKHYIIARYDNKIHRLYFLLLDRNQVMSIIDAINDNAHLLKHLKY